MLITEGHTIDINKPSSVLHTKPNDDEEELEILDDHSPEASENPVRRETDNDQSHKALTPTMHNLNQRSESRNQEAPESPSHEVKLEGIYVRK